MEIVNNKPSQKVDEVINYCDFCFNKIDRYLNYYITIERDFKICDKCVKGKNLGKAQIEFIVNRSSFSSQTITILKRYNIPFYNLSKGPCQICQEQEKFLIKLNRCNHCCCYDCLNKYIHNNLNCSKKLLCTNNGCQYEINDYLIIQFLTNDELDNWNKFSYTQFCFSKKCPATFTLNPYGNLEQNNVYELNNQMCCKSCKQQFCKVCWTQHEGQCNFEKLFEEYKKNNNIISCPYCNSLGLPQVCKDKRKWQCCFVCKKEFCLQCKGQLQLLEARSTEERISCQICRSKRDPRTNCFIRRLGDSVKTIIFAQQSFRTLFILLMPFLLVFWAATIAIFVPLYQLDQVTYLVWKLTKKYIIPKNKKLAKVLSPIISIVMIIAVVLIYIISWVPLFFIDFCIKNPDYVDDEIDKI